MTGFPRDSAYETKTAERKRNLDDCFEGAGIWAGIQVRDDTKIWFFLLTTLVPIALAWLLVWSVVSLVRWVSRGFQKPAAK